MNLIAAPKRTSYYTPVEIRALLKSKLGYNARQVTVSQRHGLTYLTITVRDPKVDLKAVEALGRTLHTWTMDQTDYSEGQSVHVGTTKEVDAIHAAPFVEVIRAALVQVALMNDGQGLQLPIPGNKILWKSWNGYYVTNEENGGRGQFIDQYHVDASNPESITRLALQAARV